MDSPRPRVQAMQRPAIPRHQTGSDRAMYTATFHSGLAQPGATHRNEREIDTHSWIWRPKQNRLIVLMCVEDGRYVVSIQLAYFYITCVDRSYVPSLAHRGDDALGPEDGQAKAHAGYNHQCHHPVENITKEESQTKATAMVRQAEMA